MKIVVNDQLKDAIEWTCRYANEYKVDIDIHIDADGEVSIGVCPTYRDRAEQTEPRTRTDEDGRVWEYRNGNWWQLGKTENSSEKPNNCTDCECTDDCTECKEAEHGCKDELQTDCGDFADRLAYERGVKHAWEVAQKVFDSTVTFYEAEDVARQIADTPQTDRQRLEGKRWTDALTTEEKKCILDALDTADTPQTDCPWK